MGIIMLTHLRAHVMIAWGTVQCNWFQRRESWWTYLKTRPIQWTFLIKAACDIVFWSEMQFGDIWSRTCVADQNELYYYTGWKFKNVQFWRFLARNILLSLCYKISCISACGILNGHYEEGKWQKRKRCEKQHQSECPNHGSQFVSTPNGLPVQMVDSNIKILSTRVVGMSFFPNILTLPMTTVSLCFLQISKHCVQMSWYYQWLQSVCLYTMFKFFRAYFLVIK